MGVDVWELPTIWVTTIFTHSAIPPAKKRDFQKKFACLFVCFMCVCVFSLSELMCSSHMQCCAHGGQKKEMECLKMVL